MNTVKFASLIAISLFLSACGGGGSDSSPAPTPPPVATTYTVSASAGTGGSISPSSRSVTSGQTTTFTVTANSGYEIDGVTGCGGSLSGNTYTTGAITSACSVSASFAQKSYEVTATAGEGGSIVPASVSVKHGATTSFTLTIDDGYDIEEVTGCGGSLSGNTYTTGAITSACTVDAQFQELAGSAVSGKVIDGYISGATVFLDLNGNEQLDTNEPRAITNNEGDYNLVLTDEEAQCRTYSALIVDVPVGAQDADFGEVTEAFRLVYPPTLLSEQESTHITPLTTVIWDFYKYQIQHIERDSAEPLSCESLTENPALVDGFSEKVDRAVDEVVRRFNLPRSILFDDYIASEDQVTAELGRQIVLGLQRSLRETFELQQQHPNAVVMVNYLRDEISWMKHVFRSISSTQPFENGWLIGGETEAYTDRLTDDFSETIGEREFWLRRGIEKEFDNYKVGISDLQEHCGSMDFLVVDFKDQGQPSFEVEVTNLSEITAAEADAYCSARSRGKYVFAPLLNLGENERGNFQMMVRYDEVNQRFAAFDDWKDFYERRDSFPYVEMPQRLLEWRFDYFDDLTEIDFFQIADSIYFSFSRYEDGLWVQYQKAGTALGVYGWRETRTVNNADGTRTFFCREGDETEFTSCDTPRFEVNASARVGGSITPLKRNLLSGSTAEFNITPDSGYEIGSVTGCNGSLSGNTYTTAAITSACQIDADFKYTNVLGFTELTGAREYFSEDCTNPSIQFVIPLTLNNDEWRDFIVHYWCDEREKNGQFVTEPTPDALVAFVSNTNGDYEIANEEIFGSKLYQLGGASRKYARGDINGDGMDDLAFAMNWEDGRSGEDPTTNATEPTILMSNISTGGYRAIRLGVSSWGHAVGILTTPEGQKDVLFAGFTEGLQAFRYRDNNFADVRSDYPDDAGLWATGFLDIKEDGLSKYVIANYNNDEIVGLKLYEREEGTFLSKDIFGYEIDRVITWITWQQTEGPVNVFRMNNEELVGGAFDDFCLLESMEINGDPIIAAKFNAQRHRNGPLRDGVVYHQNDFEVVNIMQFFKISNGNLILQESLIKDERSNANYNFFDCSDINNDGYSDFVAYVFSSDWGRVDRGGKPFVYLNDQTGSLIYTDIDYLPRVEFIDGWGVQGNLVDVNSDGVIDLLLFGTTTDINDGDVKIYLLAEPLQ